MSITVLIVEDERLVAEDISEYLTEKGMHIAGIAVSSDECFDLISKTPPDVILMDIRLKGKLNGIEIATIIHQTSRIPLIFITANQDENTIQAAIAANPHSFISKPFNLSDIRVAIELACHKKTEIPFEAIQRFNPLPVLFVKQGMVHKKINIADVLYVEADGSYSIIRTASGDYTVAVNLNTFLNQVQHPVLKRIHRSYIVNVQQVDGFDSSTLLIGDASIPVSKQYQKNLSSLFPKL